MQWLLEGVIALAIFDQIAAVHHAEPIDELRHQSHIVPDQEHRRPDFFLNSAKCLHDLALDEETRDVWRGGRFIDLTPTEYKLLHYLLSNSKRVLTRDQILEAVWDYTFAGNASVLETYISYLRHKIDNVEPPLIHTVRGVGYSLRLPREQ